MKIVLNKKIKPLEEITRYEKEMGKGYDVTKEFENLVVYYHPAEYAFSMIGIPKLGVNPGTKFNTPAGVYCYPLDRTRYEQLINNQLPYASDEPYVALVKLNIKGNERKWLIIDKDEDKQTEGDFKRCVEVLRWLLGSDIVDTVLDQTIHNGSHYDAIFNSETGDSTRKNWSSKIFDLTYFASFQTEKETPYHRKGAKTNRTWSWTSILRYLGYIGIYDSGNKVLHPAEPVQLVCLDPSAYELISIYETREVRKFSSRVVKSGVRAKEYNLKKVEKLKKWKDFASLPPEKKILDDSISFDDFYTNQIPLSVLDNAQINGTVKLYSDYTVSLDTNLVYPKNLKVNGRLFTHGVSEIPKGLNWTVKELRCNTGLEEIPDDTKITKILDIGYNENISKIPENLKLERLEILSYYSKIKKLPDSLEVDVLVLSSFFKDAVNYEQLRSFFPANLSNIKKMEESYVVGRWVESESTEVVISQAKKDIEEMQAAIKASAAKNTKNIDDPNNPNEIFESLIKKAVRVLNEANIEDLTDICYSPGSTHSMATCRLGGDKYYLKFSEEGLFDEETDPSLQILIEYLAYRIYSLYSGVKVPRPELVYDKLKQSVGLATSPAKGRPVSVRDPEVPKLGKLMSQGVYVDVFLANWDVVGTGTANVFMGDDEATRIDPGGSLTFRARGGRKGYKFSKKAGELRTMLDPTAGGSGRVFQYSDLTVAAKEFLEVPWNRIEQEINSVGEEVSQELEQRGMTKLSGQWKSDVEQILDILSERHKEVTASANMILKERHEDNNQV